MTTTLSQCTTGSRYVIPAGDEERQRLGAQYVLKKRIMGWDGAVPASIDLSRVTQVLDVAAGTCAWTLDLARMPEIQPRLAPAGREPTRDAVQLFACDIETRFLPTKAVTDPLGITTFQHDVTHAFPVELHGRFDLVHMSLLFLCLTEGGWKDAIRNCRQVLKPGGLLMLEEVDPVLYNDTQPPSEDSEGHDLKVCLNKTGWVGKANRIYTSYTSENGFCYDSTFRLPRMLAAAGYAIVDTKRIPAPWGRFCRVIRGQAGEDLSEYVDFSLENTRLIFKHLAAALLAKGKLEQPGGVKVTTDEGMEAMLQDVEAGLRGEGACTVMRYCIAKKM